MLCTKASTCACAQGKSRHVSRATDVTGAGRKELGPAGSSFARLMRLGPGARNSVLRVRLVRD